jgi:hypothetical protein
MITLCRPLTKLELVLKWYFCGLFIVVLATPLLANDPPRKPLRNSDASNLLRSLVFFEHNEGQADSRVLYLTQGLGYTTYLTRDGATLVFSSPSKSTTMPHGGTSAGTYTLVISGKVGSVSHSVNLTLKVN